MPKKLTEKQKIRRNWIKALRSGKYKQGISYLCHREGKQKIDRFCCLGVLCDLAVKARVIAPKVEKGYEIYDGVVYKFEGECEVLPNAVAKWAGLKTDIGDFDETNLTVLNDDGTSFKKIARIIESEPEGLFVEEN